MERWQRTLLTMLGIGVLVLAVAAAYFFMADDRVENNDNLIKPLEEQTNATEDKSNANQTSNEIAQESTNLVAVDAFVGKGTGTATRIFDSAFTHTVTADIPAPASGKFYEGWLVKGSQFFSTGEMNLKDGSYYLEYTNPKDQSDYNEVVITQETSANGLDGVPEAHVLEGKF